MSELYPSSSSDDEPRPKLPLILTSKTFNCIDHLKLLGFAHIKHALVLHDSAPLLRHYLFDKQIGTTDIKTIDKRLIPLIEAVYVFYDGASNSADIQQLGDWFSAEGVKVYVSHCAPGDVRSGARPY